MPGKSDKPKEKKPSKSEARKARRAAKQAQRKQPATTVDVTGAKRPRLGPEVEPRQDARITFGLSRMDNDGSWSWANMTPAHVKMIAEACAGWQTLRNGEFMNMAGNKPIPVENLCPAAQKRLTEIELDDYDRLWELRLGGTERIWGVLEDAVFYVVWWDPEHEVCPSTKKHT